ncbi:AMSH-like ubiquitin thioesterase 2 isoform X3 [Amaranthus tricolor]|uniref:AMSH-like ubiquitin thioesterase 2 isoform X3 n=1 Tax=Amaranthus tricolor TaxID=29722 RepID=UPI00258BEB23|nr:AMSH-like ubiquitin thioesterase 2 isoform X3 [Amaranthus tricolor]
MSMVTHYPSAAISCTEVAPNAAEVSQVTTGDTRYAYSDTAMHVLKNIHISAQLMEDFLQLACNNTEKDLETCGVLGASLKEETFYATTLIIPKQESTSSSCQALKEEEIFNIQNDRSLLPVGWIHVMVPEAIAIVVAPTDKTRNYGIFRLTDPSGMNVLKECEEKGFHPHRDPNDGRPLYEQCSHVYINPNLRFEIFDLR